jgi:glucose/arabinose dehydrogenase
MRLPPVLAVPLLLLALPLLVLLVACGDDPVPAPAPEVSPPVTQPPERKNQPEKDQITFEPDRVALDLRPVAGGFESPIGLTDAPDAESRLYVIEQPGRIRSFTSGGDVQPFLDISDRLVAGGEQGLLGLAFHPDYEEDGRFFVNYTDTNGDTVVSSFTAPDGAGDPSSEQILLTVDQPFANHNGGHLAFGPDGYLYIALGDGGSAGDPENNGQRLDTLLGKLLRIDVDAGGSDPYAIPDDNPFAGEEEARPEIWAYGLRNPWRFSFDRETGDLWIADVGQDVYEEVNREAARGSGGLNYGWRVVEGPDCYEEGCDTGDFVAPVATYTHDFGCSITGGYVYRGEAFPNLQGAYVAGDYCSGNIWALPADVRSVADPEPALDTELRISSFGEDADGELYLTDAAGGSVFQVIDGEN